MNKKQKDFQKKQVYDSKTLLLKYLKRYGITILIAGPIIMFVNYVLSNEVEGYFGIASFFASLAMLLLALLIGLVVFGKIDAKHRREATPESERDPFAD